MSGSSRTWTLMASHGVVLFFLAARPDSTMRQMSETLGLTERQIARIVRNLDEAGLLEVRRIGRRNTYRVNENANFRHPALSHVPLRPFVELLSSYGVRDPSHG